MNKTELEVISYLKSKGKGKSLNQLYVGTKVSKANVEQAIYELEKQGYIKVDMSPSGKRITDISLTDKGIEVSNTLK